MGSPDVFAYLASREVVSASALSGKISAQDIIGSQKGHLASHMEKGMVELERGLG